MVDIRSSIFVPAVFLSLTLLVLGSLTYQSIAETGTRGASANCNSCHSSSIYLTVDIRTVEAPTVLNKGDSGYINVTVDVSASHRSAVWSGFSIDVWLVSSGGLSTGGHQVLTGQAPQGSSSPYSWTSGFDFQVTAVATGSDTITAKAKMDPVHESPPVTDTEQVQVDVPNTDPILSSGSVFPGSGFADESFRFEVEYLDADGDDPASIKVFIDGISYQLQDLPGGDGSVTDGEMFGIADLYLDEGSHSYHFEASDGSSPTRYPLTGELDGPMVLHRNIRPQLKQGYVTPSVGFPGEEFDFYVTYSDPENDAPDPGVFVGIDGIDNWTKMEEDQSVSGFLNDGSYVNGELFKVTLILDLGTHQFRFNASDGNLSSEIGPYSGPEVDETPSLAAMIMAPQNGTMFLSNVSIDFNGTFSSNVDVEDAVASWTSNISGSIGSGWSFSKMLAAGHHRIDLRVSSGVFGLTDEDSIDIIVNDPVVIPEVDLISGCSPATEVEIDELDNATFSITLDPDHPLVKEGEVIIITWFFDGQVRTSGVLEWTYRSSYIDSGEFMVYVQLEHLGELVGEYSWNLTVNDIPAPILIMGDIQDDLGSFEKRDLLRIPLPVQDAAGRELTVEWSIDDKTVNSSSIILELELKSGPWAQVGSHIVKAVVKNPDNTELVLTFDYIILEEKFPDDDDDDDIIIDPVVANDDEEIDVMGAIIVILGTIVILVGIVNVVISMLPEKKKGDDEGSDEVELQEGEMKFDEADPWSGPDD